MRTSQSDNEDTLEDLEELETRFNDTANEDDDIGQEFPSPEFQENISEAGSDIEIDDYPVEDIFPVFNMMSFIKHMDNFEKTVLENYAAITEAEEEMNEHEVERLLQTFDEQKSLLKGRVFSIHKEAYNTRRDIGKYGSNLERIYLLKEKSTEERDLVRFKIERLAIETEEQIDALNDKLREQRNQADVLLKKYRKYIEQFDMIE